MKKKLPVKKPKGGLIPDVVLKFPKIPDQWDYYKSVAEFKEQYLNWKNMTIEMLEILWIAKQKTNKPPEDRGQGRKPKEITPHLRSDYVEVPSWDWWCKDGGIAKSTADRWLGQYEEWVKTGVKPQLTQSKSEEVDGYTEELVSINVQKTLKPTGARWRDVIEEKVNEAINGGALGRIIDNSIDAGGSNAELNVEVESPLIHYDRVSVSILVKWTKEN